MLIVALAAVIVSLTSIVVAYMAVMEKRLVHSIIYLSTLSVCYSILYYVLMAPDVVLAYIPISTTILPLLLLSVAAKIKEGEKRCERKEA
ncbi:MAG: hydrogenase subunit MbhD domain-containing protein [Desulfurococcaceae archaeon]